MGNSIPNSPMYKQAKAAAMAVGKCVTCNVKCQYKFWLGTDMPLVGELHSKAGIKAIELSVQQKASEFAAMGAKFALRKIAAPFTIASGIDTVICHAECF